MPGGAGDEAGRRQGGPTFGHANRGSHVPGNVARNERILSGGGADDGRFSGKFGEAHYATPSEPVVTWHRNQRWSHPDQLPAAGASSRWTLGRQA